MCRIRAVLFDMDGVLIDAKEWHYEALNRALGLFGYEISRYDHLHTFDGLPTKDKLKLLSEVVYLPSELYEFINLLKQQYTKEIVAQKCKPIFQHEYALARLKKEGFTLAVCSNSIRQTIVDMMGKAGLIEYLDLIMSNEDVKKSKPDPEIYTAAMIKLKLKPKECLILEDNKNGIAAAKRSGGNLLQINTVYDVTYTNIKTKIECIENGEKSDGTYYDSSLRE